MRRTTPILLTAAILAPGLALGDEDDWEDLWEDQQERFEERREEHRRPWHSGGYLPVPPYPAPAYHPPGANYGYGQSAPYYLHDGPTSGMYGVWLAPPQPLYPYAYPQAAGGFGYEYRPWRRHHHHRTPFGRGFDRYGYGHVGPAYVDDDDDDD